MNKRIRLTDDEATALGLKLNISTEGNPKYIITEDQQKRITEIRSKGVLTSCNSLEVDPTTVKHLWKKNQEASAFVKNPLYVDKLEKDFDTFQAELIDDLKKYSPKFPKIKRKKTTEGHLLVVDIADLHINKYATQELTGADYNSQIAVERAIEGTKGLLQKSVGFNIDKVLFVIGNDVLNTDNLTKSTTKNTPQDTDLSWFEAFKIAKECYVKCIELCLSVADVDIIHCPSNHDFLSGCFLAQTLEAYFRNCNNITFDISPAYRKYYQYFNNLIELEHGDKGKVANLPLVIAQSQPKMWAETKFRYGYLHHVHHTDKVQHQSSKDYIGINITYLRSPSSADIWHSDSSYLNMVAVEGFIHSKENGRVSHLTHYF
tara:strand:+ start:1776 stop:2900 length:1125 start_codon:yes stop_codon:yes gene_type:complete